KTCPTIPKTPHAKTPRLVGCGACCGEGYCPGFLSSTRGTLRCSFQLRPTRSVAAMPHFARVARERVPLWPSGPAGLPARLRAWICKDEPLGGQPTPWVADFPIPSCMLLRRKDLERQGFGLTARSDRDIIPAEMTICW